MIELKIKVDRNVNNKKNKKIYFDAELSISVNMKIYFRFLQVTILISISQLCSSFSQISE